jgi:UDP:flavonoid glycosyltransferase YjiC (YdhE family)
MQFLFGMFDGGGNVDPLLAVANALRARGHGVRILAGPTYDDRAVTPDFLTRLAAEDFPVVPLRRAGRPPCVTRPRGLLWGRTGKFFGPLWFTHHLYASSRDWAQGMVDELRQNPADVVVSDYLLPGALVGAEAAGVPAAALLHTVYFVRPAPGIPPGGPGLMPASGPAGRLRDTLVAAAIQRVHRRDALPLLNQARADFGLPGLRSPFHQYDLAARVLVLTHEGFDFRARSLPPNVRYTGMPFRHEGTARPWESPWPADDRRPLVLVSLSTTFQDQAPVLARLLRAFDGQAARGLVTVGPAVDTRDFTAPPNVALRSWVPHAAVLPQSSAVVTHCGHGTVMAALSHGVPIVGLPMGRDQNDVAARVVAGGLGLRLAPTAASEQLWAAIRRVVAEPSFRQAAEQMRMALAREHGARRAAEELEALAPLTRTRGGVRDSLFFPRGRMLTPPVGAPISAAGSRSELSS